MAARPPKASVVECRHALTLYKLSSLANAVAQQRQ
jgi:hypothetical protein